MDVSNIDTQYVVQIPIDSNNPMQPTTFIVSDIPKGNGSDETRQRLKYNIDAPSLPFPTGNPSDSSTHNFRPSVGYHSHRVRDNHVIQSILHDNPHYGTQYDRCKNFDYRWSPSMRPRPYRRDFQSRSPMSFHQANALPALEDVGCCSKCSKPTESALSTMINDTASKYRELVQKQCKPDSNSDSDDADDTDKSKVTESTEQTEETKRNHNNKEIENEETSFAEYATQIFSRSKPIIRDALQPMWNSQSFRDDIISQRLHEAIGAMKGITEGICLLLDEAMKLMSKKDSFGAFRKNINAKYRVNRDIMHSLFEKEVLAVFCAILLRAPLETRDGLSRYLSNRAFSKYFEIGTALKGQLHRIISASELKLTKMRDDEEREIFEKTTTHLLNEANTSRDCQKQPTEVDHIIPSKRTNATEIVKQSHSPRYGTPFPFTPMYYQYPVDLKPGQKRHMQSSFDSSGKRIRPTKSVWDKRKNRMEEYQFFSDGKWRRKQRNPCQHKKCRNPLQTDGVTKGCGKGTHPRTVCPCWVELGFRKGDWKNGKIHKWLEARFPSKQFKWQ